VGLSSIAGGLRTYRFEARRRSMGWRYLRGDGLEIGALHYPQPLGREARVRYVDRMSREQLLAQYPELASERLVEVNVIDDGEVMSSQNDESVDFIVANHFIEHTENPLATLGNLLRVIRPGGVLYMAVPDRHRTFDRSRSPTSLDHVVRDFEEGPAWSHRLHQEEWASLVEQAPSEYLSMRVGQLEESRYSIHFHVWDRREFRALLDHAAQVMGLPFAITRLQQNQGEFIAVLTRTRTESRSTN
jgi:predicted SAM-dependent methyltransferase